MQKSSKHAYAVNNIIPKLLVGIVLGVIVVAGFLLMADLRKVTIELKDMPGHYLFLAFLLTLASYFLRLLKWHTFSKWSGFGIGLKDNTVIFFIGLMMSITPGKAGELIKSYYMQKKANVPYSSSIPVIIYDRLTDLLAMMALVGIGFLAYPFGIMPFIVLLGLIVLFFLLIQKSTFITGCIHWITKPKKLLRFRRPLKNFYQQTLFLMRFRYLCPAFAISFVAWLLECVSLYVIIVAFSADVSLLASIFTFSLGTLAGALSMIPGGLGAAEGSITGMLIYFGVGGSLAVTISLLIRFVTLWFGVFIGFLVFLGTVPRYFKVIK